MHRLAKALWERQRPELITSDYVFDETVTVVKARAGHEAGVLAGEALLTSNRLLVEVVGDEYRSAAWEIFRSYGDKLWSFTDCASKAIIDRLACEQVWSFDTDFRQMGYQVLP